MLIQFLQYKCYTIYNRLIQTSESWSFLFFRRLCMDELEIAFDTKEKFEYLIKYSPLEYTGNIIKDSTDKYYIFKKQNLVPNSIGTFLLAFFNTNFNNVDNFKKFTLEYLFIHLFF